MRYIFISLLLANIGFFAWQKLRDENRTTVASGEQQTEDKAFSTNNTVDLLSERGGSDKTKTKLEQVVRSPQVETKETESEECLSVGPFEDMFEGRNIVERLASLDLDPELRAVDQTTGDNDYRVMIPPASSVQNAFRKLRELKAQDIDSYVITRGPDALGISLGLFSSRDGAETLAASRRKNGYEVEISEIPRLRREYWIFSARSTDLDIPSGVWASLLESHPELERRKLACNFN